MQTNPGRQPHKLLWSRSRKRAGRHTVWRLVLIVGFLIPGPCPGALDSQQALVPRMDAALAKSGRYLLSRQSRDGAWRSETYGILKDGPSLTPLVLSALFFMPQGGPAVRSGYRKGATYLAGLIGGDGRVKPPKYGLSYPVLSAALASRVVALEKRTPEALRAQQAWLAYLRARQLTSALGWQPGDNEFGGWGFAMEIPRKPRTGRAKALLVESNLLSTTFGIGALRSARVPASDPSYRDALTFVKRCQNFPEDPSGADPRFDDGGFFFIPDDPLQNKAGIAGRDRNGRVRFHSYGSMTADGLRALVRCGLPITHPRVAAARQWLERNYRVDHHPGVFPRDREVLRDATYYYYCWAVAHAFAALEGPTGRSDARWAEAMAKELIRRQRPDGSWSNRFTDAKEDDPLVATSWASASLAICRQALTGEEKAIGPRAARG